MIYQLKIVHVYNTKYDVENVSLSQTLTAISIREIVNYIMSSDNYFRLLDCSSEILSLLIANGLDYRKLSFWDDMELSDKYSELLYLTNEVIANRVSEFDLPLNNYVIMPLGDIDFVSQCDLNKMHPVLYDFFPFQFETVMGTSLYEALLYSCSITPDIESEVDAAVYYNKCISSKTDYQRVEELHKRYIVKGGFRNVKAYLLTLWSLAVNKIAYPIGNRQFIVMCDYSRFESIFKMYYTNYFNTCDCLQNIDGFSPSAVNFKYSFWDALKDSFKQNTEGSQPKLTDFFD